MILYKYYPCNENTFKALSVGALWCHRADMMNDPFECLAGADCHYTFEELEILRSKLHRKKEDKSLIASTTPLVQFSLSLDDNALSKFINDARKKMIEKYAFCSLSEKGDDILMWSHYANGHKGCAIGFEFNDLPEDIHLQKVSYSDDPINIDLECLANVISGSDDQENMRQFLSSMSVKGKAWEQEREWRIWRNEPSYWKYDIARIKHVYFGTKCTIETKAAVWKLLNLPDDFLYNDLELKFSPLRLEV